MASDRPERRVAVILAADAVGYSRLVGEGEEAALETLRKHRGSIDGSIEEHRGRVFSRAGDSVVAEFASAVEAVRCAVEIQEGLAKLNRDLPENRRMPFRIGINLGDIVVEGDDLLGDGVNVAARLESAAKAGGILVSGSVHDQVHDKLELVFEDVGALPLKNIPNPVRAYRVKIGGDGSRKTSPASRPSLSRRILFGGAAAVGLLVLAVVATWPLALRPFADFAGVTALPVDPPLPARPSIVVLPFDNMSDDPDQEYFSDGITEDLTTDLSSNPNLFVISRGSAFTYKGKNLKPEQIGRELGVAYVLEGSVRKSGNRVRVNAQLIDTSNGFHVWSRRYDRELDDIFDVQSEITEQILTELRGEIRDAELFRQARRRTRSIEAYDAYLRGTHEFEKFTRAGHREARRWFQRAVALDPDFVTARALLANSYVLEYILGWNLDEQLLKKGEALAREALAIDPDDPAVHQVLASVHLGRSNSEQAIAASERVMAYNPNFDVPYLVRALALLQTGKPMAALDSLQQGMRLNPKGNTFKAMLGLVNFQLGRRDEAMAFWRQSRQESELLPPRLGLLLCFVEDGREEDAGAMAKEILDINPDLTATDAAGLMDNFFDTDAVEKFRQGGLP